MATLETIPKELMFEITLYLPEAQDIASLALACRRTYPVANVQLYRHVKKNHSALLCWASEHGMLETVRHLLEAGADVNECWKGRDAERRYTEGHPRSWDPRQPIPSPLQMLRGFYGYPRMCTARGDPNWPVDQYTSRAEIEVDFESLEGPEEGPQGPEVASVPPHGERAHDVGYIMPQPNLHRWGYVNPRFPSLDFDKPQAGEGGLGTFERRKACVLYPLHLATMCGHAEVVELLLRYGADLKTLASRICNCGHPTLNSDDRYVWGRKSHFEEVATQELLMQSTLVTPLHVAIEYDRPGIARMLIQYGADGFFDRPRFEAHDVHTAARYGNLPVLRMMLAQGGHAGVNYQDSRGLTPLYYAYWRRRHDTFTWLLYNGADVDAELGAGLTLLHLACIDGDFDVATRLVDAGADVNRAWSESICQYLGRMRPLELCALLHHTKSLRQYAKDDPFLHEARFELRKLELMKKLLDAGALTSPIQRPLPLGNRFPHAQISVATIAAAHHSIPLLEFLAGSGVNMAQEPSAIHEAIYSTSMYWEEDDTHNPMATVQWLREHGASMQPASVLTADAVAFVCQLPQHCPWKYDLLEWLFRQGFHPDVEFDNHCLINSRRGHPMLFYPMLLASPLPIRRRSTAFREALHAHDFRACETLLACPAPVDMVEAFHDLTRTAQHSWRQHKWDSGLFEEEARKNRSRLGFLLKADQDETIKRSTRTFLCLATAVGLPPSSFLLDTALPTGAIMPAEGPMDHVAVTKALHTFRCLRDVHRSEDPKSQREWDLAYRLVTVIVKGHWNAVHFLVEHGADIPLLHEEEGMGYFATALAAVRLMPSPTVIGYAGFQNVLRAWDTRGERANDLRIALLHEACAEAVDVGPFLEHPGLDVNAPDGRGDAAIHRLLGQSNRVDRLMAHIAHPGDGGPRNLVALLKAGADLRAVNREGESGLRILMAPVRRRQWVARDGLSAMEVVSHHEDAKTGRLEVTLRLRGVNETFVFD